MDCSAEGESLPELFEAAAVNLVNELIDADSVGEALREKLVLEAPDLPSLLQEWLNMLLELIRVQRMVFSDFHVLEIAGEGPFVLRAEVTGELIDPHRHLFRKKIVGLTCRQTHLKGDAPFRSNAQFGY